MDQSQSTNNKPNQRSSVNSTNQSANTPPASILDCIPRNIWLQRITPHLQHSSSYVRVITGEPSAEQKASIITKLASDQSKETNFFTSLFKTNVVVHGYLLIKYPGNINDNNRKTTYAVGYYNQQGQYCESPVSDKSSLHNYLSNNPVILNNSAKDFVNDDPDLLRWVSRAVKDNGGQLARANSDVLNLSLTNKANLQFFEPNRKQEYFQILLDAVVRSEYDRAERVPKFYELLLSQYKGSITDTGIAEITFHKATAFQLAVWAGNWVMWEKMLAAIPLHLKTEYEDDLREQLIELKEKGLTYTLDNIKACGLRILDDEPSKALKVDVCEHNAYLFIIDQQTGDCSLGFKDPETGQYKECKLDPTSDLKNHANVLQQALDDHRNIDKLPHCVIRDELILELARKEIKQHGGHTEITETSTSYDHTPLLNALEEYSSQFDYNNWSLSQLIEHWCVTVGGLQRLLPAAVWNCWMNPDIDWRKAVVEDFDRPLPPAYRPTFDDNVSLFPLVAPFGDKFAAGSCLRVSGSFLVETLPTLDHLFQARSQKLNHLYEILNLTPPTNQPPDCLMM